MADTAVRQITDEILARLANITVANGYNTTVKKKEKSKLTTFTGSSNMPRASFWILNKPNTTNKYGGNEHDLSFIAGYFDSVGGTTVPFIDAVDELEADLVTALYRSTANPAVSDDISLDLGGLVTDLSWDDTEYVIGEGAKPWCGVLILFTAKFQSSLNDPYSISA